MFYSKGGETLEWVFQRSCGCPVPGSVEAQVGWGSEQPHPVEGVPAHKGLELDDFKITPSAGVWN